MDPQRFWRLSQQVWGLARKRPGVQAPSGDSDNQVLETPVYVVCEQSRPLRVAGQSPIQEVYFGLV